MFDAFDALFSFISSIIAFFSGFVNNIIFVFDQIKQGFVVAAMAVLHMPDIVKVFVTAIIGYSVVINVIHLGD